jgi:hypothetical protein
MVGAYVAAMPTATYGQVTIGPITLGKPWPAVPACPKRTASDPFYDGLGICRDGYFVWNVPFDGANLIISVLDRCSRDAACPIGEVDSNIPCDDVLNKLKAKFGAPDTQSAQVMNGSGARWTSTSYIWPRKNGDSLVFIRHREISDCQIVAETAEHRKEQAKPQVKL